MAETSQAEQFKAELEVLLAKYPTVRLTVNHQISIDELIPKQPMPNGSVIGGGVAPKVPEPQVGEQTAPTD